MFIPGRVAFTGTNHVALALFSVKLQVLAHLVTGSNTEVVVCSLVPMRTCLQSHYYSNCPKVSYTNFYDKMAYANSADPDQTTPDGAV